MTILWSALVFVLLALPALRLLRMPEEGRSPAELTVAAFFLLSAVGMALRFQVISHGAAEGPGEVALNAAGHLAISLACVALFVFTRRLFRPTEEWARWLLVLGVGGSLLALVGPVLDGGYRHEGATSLLFVNGLRTAAFAWSSGEALRYWRLISRRRALGLADPILENRFLLWSIWSGGLTACFGFTLLSRFAARMGVISQSTPALAWPAVRAVLGVVVLASVVSVWLCFFPPAGYRRWLLQRG